MTKQGPWERRQHKRYRVNNRLIAVVRSTTHQLEAIDHLSKGEIAIAVIKSHPPRMGEIVEISRGGLSFRYVACDADLSTASELDILFADEDFHLSRLPFQPVEDRSIKAEVPFDVLAMKRMSVKFGGLSAKQKMQLDHVLKNYTSGSMQKPSRQTSAGVAAPSNTNM